MDINTIAIIQKYLPLIIPVVLLELGLMIAALVDVIRREKTKGPKWIWIIVVVVFNLFGPIIYFVFGRDE